MDSTKLSNIEPWINSPINSVEAPPGPGEILKVYDVIQEIAATDNLVERLQDSDINKNNQGKMPMIKKHVSKIMIHDEFPTNYVKYDGQEEGYYTNI